MPYGTQDGYAAPSPKEQLALDVYNMAHETNEYDRVTWDSLNEHEMLQVNAIYALLNEYTMPTGVVVTDYYGAATSLSEVQWNALVDISRDTELQGRYMAAEHFAPGRATLKSLVRRGYTLHMADGSYKTTDLGEKIVHALD